MFHSSGRSHPADCCKRDAARLETGLRGGRVFGAQGNPGFSRWVWKAGEDSDDRQVVPVASKDDRRPEFCGGEIGEGESDEDDIT